MNNKLALNLIKISAFVFLLSCQPASVSYIEPKSTSSAQGASQNSCTLIRRSVNEVQISCPDGTTEIIRDGQNGLNGVNGTNGTDGRSVEIIDPCGAESRIGFDEVLIRLPNRTVIAYFEFGTYRHLTILTTDQLYMTTDDTRCEFKIDSDGIVYDSKGGLL